MRIIMKIKLHYILFVLVGLLTFACEPLDDIKDELDENYTGPLRKDLKYELEAADYNTISKLAQEDATTPEELEMAKQIAVDTVLYPGISVDYIPTIIEEVFKGYGTKSISEVVFRLADEIGATADSTAEYYEMQPARFWKFSPVIEIDMNSDKAFYQYITDFVQNDEDLGKHWEAKYLPYGRDLYYGSTAKYYNFDLVYHNRANSSRDMEGDAEIDPVLAALYDASDLVKLEETLIERVVEGMNIMLQEHYKDSGAEILSNGVTITYKVLGTCRFDDRSNQIMTCNFNCTKASPNPEFELLSGPVFSVKK